LFHRRFVGLGLVIILSLLFAAWIASNVILDVLPHFLNLDGLPQSWQYASFTPLLSSVVPFLLTLAMFFGLYWRLPNREVPWSVALWGAFVAAAGSQIVTKLFSWYITSGFANYALVYGSLGAIVAFMFWVYLLSQITLFGAHLSAAIGYSRHRKGR
jgi:membrane protein